MNTKELLRSVQSDDIVHRTFGGVLPRDKLPREILKDFPVSFIVNTDTSRGPGQHWVAFYLESPHYGNFSILADTLLNVWPRSLRSFLLGTSRIGSITRKKYRAILVRCADNFVSFTSITDVGDTTCARLCECFTEIQKSTTRWSTDSSMTRTTLIFKRSIWSI